VIASIPQRGPVHDVILARSAEFADALRLALEERKLPSQPIKIGSSSPRRAWQAERFLGCTAVPIRGNVPTRISKLIAGQYDAICLAAAGLHRLNVQHDYQIDLPIDRFPTAPGQGALAIQTHRAAEWMPLLQAIEHAPTRQCVQAERTFLHVMKAGCHAPLAAAAVLENNQVCLHVQMRLGSKACFEQIAYGVDPEQLGQQLAEQALQAEKQP
jgi:hydroxymethylbilane synthase